MDTLRAARYPFLDEAKEFAGSHSADLAAMILSPAYEAARKRGLDRVMDAIRRSEVSYVKLSFEHERLMEVMSYPYARMLVSCIDDRFLTKRYALSEAVRMSILLEDERPETLISIAKELNVDAVAKDEMLMMHFTDYLKLASRIKSIDWKLVNSELFNGNVFLSGDKFCRALQNAMQDKIESELPIGVPDDIRKIVSKDVNTVELALNEMKTRFGDSVGGDVMVTEFPPCIRTLLAGTQNGLNLPHSGRFALVAFLHALGMDSEQIMELFAKSPDFDASKTIYQVKHITGELSGTEYTPPECSTMKSYGICFEPDDLCGNEKVVHPLIYYRIRTRTQRRDVPAAEEKKE